jgi:predicted benzoate:H+ symporter BenE
MLAGVLLILCLVPVHAVAEFPVYGLLIVITWAVVSMTTDVTLASKGNIWPTLVFVSPTFSFAGVVGIALPLVYRHHGGTEHSRSGCADRQWLQAERQPVVSRFRHL